MDGWMDGLLFSTVFQSYPDNERVVRVINERLCAMEPRLRLIRPATGNRTRDTVTRDG